MIQSLLLGLAVSSAAWLLNYLVAFVAEWREKLNPPCDLPVLNLKGWKFNQARQEYVTRLDYYLEIGRSKHKETGYQVRVVRNSTAVPLLFSRKVPLVLKTHQAPADSLITRSCGAQKAIKSFCQRDSMRRLVFKATKYFLMKLQKAVSWEGIIC